MLQRRHILNMKWRTAIMSAIILALFTFGPSFKDNQGEVESNRVARSLLQDVSDSQGKEAEPCSNKAPDCNEEDPAVFKRNLKAWYRCVSQPEDHQRDCAADTKTAQRECNKDEHTDGTWKLTIDSNKCRTLTFTCSGTFANGTEASFIPPEANDPLFPPDAFSEETRNSGAFVFHILGVLYMFLALALVCDHFFVPTLDVITEKYSIRNSSSHMENIYLLLKP